MSLSDSLKSEITKMVISGKAQTFKLFSRKGFEFYAEEWKSCCLEPYFKEGMEDSELFDIVFDLAEKIVKEAKYEGYFYIEPENCGIEYGITVFYRQLRKETQKVKLLAIDLCGSEHWAIRPQNNGAIGIYEIPEELWKMETF